MTAAERVYHATLAMQSAELAQRAYEAVLAGDGADACALAAQARRSRLMIEAATGAEADEWAAAMARIVVPQHAADLAPVHTVAMAGGAL